MNRANCCKVLFHQLLIFSLFTDSAAEIALLEMDILLIYIEINLTHSGRVCVLCVYVHVHVSTVCGVCLCVCVGGMGGICVAWICYCNGTQPSSSD